MSTEVGRGVVPIEADVSNLSKDLEDKVKGQQGGIGKVFGDLGKFAGAALVGAAGLAVAGVAGLAKLGESFDEAYDHIRITTGQTGAALTGLQDDFKAVASSVPVDFGQAGDAVASLNQKLGLSGKPLQDLSVQMLNLSRITKTDLQTNIDSVTGTFNQWGVTADQQGTKLDELYRISQQTGVSFATLSSALSQGGVQFRQAGLSFEQSGAMIGLLAKNGLDAGSVIPALSKAMAAAAKTGQSASDVFQGVFGAIKGASSDTEAASLAIDTFGAKAGPKFAALIREGKLSYDDFAKSISGGGDTINEAAKQTDDWREKLKLLMNKVFVVLEPLASKVFGAIGTAIDKLTPFIQRVAVWFTTHLPGAIRIVEKWISEHLLPIFRAVVNWVKDHWPQIEAIATAVFNAIRDAIAYFVDVIIPKAVAGFKAVFGWLMDHKEVLIGVAAAIAVGLVALFTSWAAGAASAAAATLAAAAPFIAIGVAIAAVVAGVIYAYKHFTWFHDAVDAVGRFLRDKLLPAAKEVFGWLRDHIPPIIEGIAKVFGDIVGWIREHWEQIKAVVETAINVVRTIIETQVNIIIDLWHRFGDDIIAAAQLVWEYIRGIVQAGVDIVVGIFDFFRDLFTGKWGKLWGDVRDVLYGIWEAIKVVVQTALDAIGIILQTAWDAIKLAASLVWDGIKLVITGVWDAIKLAASLVWDGIKLYLSTLWDGIKAAAGLVWEGIKLAVMTPINALTGLIGLVWDGIKSAASTAWEGVKQVVLLPISAITLAINGITSFISGIWNGLEDGAKTVWDKVTGIVTGAIDGIKALAEGIWNAIKGPLATAVNGAIGIANGIIRGINDISPFGDIPQIKPVAFHAGGTVPGTTGTEVPAMLLAGETVRTTSQEGALQSQLAMAGAAIGDGGGRGTFVYSPTIISPDHQVGKLVGDAIAQYVRFNGRLPWTTPGGQS